MLRLSLARLTGESHSRGSDQMLQHFSHVIISPQNPCKSKMLHRHFSYPVTLQPPLHRSSPKFLIGGALVTHFCHIFMRSGWLACCHKNEVSYHMFPCCVIICLLVLYIDTGSAKIISFFSRVTISPKDRHILS